jgi:hypothetical protein
MLRRNLNTILMFSLLATALAACGDSSEEVAPPDTSLPDTGTPDTGDTGTTDTSNPSDTGEPDTEIPEDVTDVTDTTVQPDTGTDTGGDTVEPTDVEPDVPVNCDGPDGCYACPPTTQDQFLNACTDAASAVFDNEARLPLLNADGSLPPLP